MSYFKIRKEIVNDIKDAINNLCDNGVINTHHKELSNNRFFYPRSYINKLLKK